MKSGSSISEEKRRLWEANGDEQKMSKETSTSDVPFNKLASSAVPGVRSLTSGQQ